MEALDMPYMRTPFFEMVRKRGGWLSALFLGEMLTATAMGYFENEIGSRFLYVDSLGQHREIRGGEVLLLGTIEARFPLFWILGGAVFTDAGNVWDRTQNVTLRRVFTVTGPGAGYSDMRYSAGAGIRIRTPVGPVRFDYGWKLRRAKTEERDLSSSRGAFHFSLGQAF